MFSPLYLPRLPAVGRRNNGSQRSHRPAKLIVDKMNVMNRPADARTMSKDFATVENQYILTRFW